MEVDVVVPLKASDFERFSILQASMHKFWRCRGNIYVVVPDLDWWLVPSWIQGDPWLKVLRESQVVPELSPEVQVNGWWKQQLIKLGILPRIKTDFYLTFDADCFLVRCITAKELIYSGRGVVEYMPHSYFPGWYDGSTDILGLSRRPRKTVSVTPFLFNYELMRSLHQRLQEIAPVNRWQQMLLMNTGWTEYSLYHTWADHCGVWDQFHFNPGHKLLGNCIWYLEDAKSWRAADSFIKPKFYYTVVQSNTCIPASWTWSKVESYLC